ncbi:flagellar export chaperone FliS [Geothermobacter hydrogeniphilus]|uniref:Flagellar secretion chaperone FliS n=1 Tax=Geothermobacter hydrogeniphilus TaxID=1969733 RepID=A0A1X0YEA7_9BACT|nr:flagellar export chaperone FliS [Geothermobacter hydrogeniphilus]ORJ63476.1 flagellar export chaperone FliS [Geothermobacter hydrogeniphilus]
MNAFWNQYQQNQVNQATPEQILIMLYDGAIRNTVQAIQALANADRVRKAESISKAIHIVTTLSDTLDHEIGGEIAENLDALYNFIIRELTNGNLKNDPAPLRTVEDLLRDLRQTWSEAIEIRNRELAEKRQEAAPPEPARRLTAQAQV